MDKKYFVLTGRLNAMSREEAIKAIIQHGGIVQHMVTPQTNYLIVGGFQLNLFEPDHLSRKRKMAEILKESDVQIEIMSEDKFLAWIQQ